MPEAASAAAPSAPATPAAAPSGGAPNLPSSGGNAPSNPAGSSAPNKPPVERAPAGLAERLRAAAEAEKPGREPRVIKHKLEDGNEIDVDISEHVSAALAAAMKRKLKVNGQEIDVDADEAFEKYPLTQGAHEKFEEAAKARKEVAQFKEQLAALGKRMGNEDQLRDLLSNPKLLGPERLLKFAESIVMDAIKQERMTPEQRASLQKQREIEQAARKRDGELSQREARIKAAEEKAQQAEAAKHTAYFQENIPKFLEQAGVPVTAETFEAWKRMKGDAIRLKMPHTDAAIAKEVAARYFEGLKSVASKLDPAKLSELLGENAAKIGQAAVEAHRAPGSQVSVKGRKEPAANGAIPAHIKTPDQYRQWQYDQKVKARAGR